MTREERERKETRSKLIIGLILVGVMVLSTAGYAFYNTKKEEVKRIEYRGVEFVLEEDGLWHFNIQEQEFSTFYNPRETENISSLMFMSFQNYAGKVLYFSSDSEREGIEEIIRNIRGFILRTQYVCLDECEGEWAVKTCEDNVVIIKEVGENLIRQENSCIYILASEGEVMRVSDAFIFKILGII